MWFPHVKVPVSLCSDVFIGHVNVLIRGHELSRESPSPCNMAQLHCD